jgi:hypothetical protein
MQNTVVRQNGGALAHFAAIATKSQELRLLKFVKGKYQTGDDEVPLGRQFIAHMDQLAHGWSKFLDGKVVEQRVGLIADGFRASEREELGDMDQSEWERDTAGKPRDPWVCQYYLALEDAETGELLTFVTGTAGGNSAIGRLCGQFSRNAKNGLPVIRLAASSYRHKHYGRVEVPDFPVIGWTGSALAQEAVSDFPVIPGAAPAHEPVPVLAGADEMDDAIPF